MSKSKFIDGVQCEKLLWHRVKDRAAIPPPSADTVAVFEQGRAVGELAKGLFPGGVGIPWTYDIERAIEQSTKAIEARKTIFEAWIVSEFACAKVDVLRPADDGAWDLIEVKSTTEVKKEHYDDVAFQIHACQDSGIKIRKCYLMHINKTYERDGKIDPAKLFTTKEITAEAVERVPDVREEFQRMRKVLELDQSPQVAIGQHCRSPYICQMKEKCWDFLPKQNVFQLHYDRGFKTALGLMERNILDIGDVPGDTKLTEFQKIQVNAAKSGKPILNLDNIRTFFGRLKYPLYFLDFETVAPAIPVYNHTRPYQQVPFQYSLHVLDKPDAKARHTSWLADGTDDPREEILRRLKQELGDYGTIVAYNAPFELRALAESVETYSAYQSWFKKIETRFVDLLEPFKNAWYYHPDQNGSASQKAVLPALTGRSYKGMEIAEGGMASREYYRVTFTAVPPEERARVRAALETYCCTDTQGMVDIIQTLEQII